MNNEFTVENLQNEWDAFIEDVKKFEEKGNKSAGRRARIKSIDLREMLKNWRKISLH
jgi:hypothetical protein